MLDLIWNESDNRVWQQAGCRRLLVSYANYSAYGDISVSQRIEFGTKAAADQFRDEHDEHVCPLDDDRRLKTVAVIDDTPEWVFEQAEIEAASGRADRDGGAGQVELTEREREEIDFSTGRANVPWAKSVKGIARSEGVDDWLAHVDESLTVDEHREVMERAARDDRGRRLDEETSADDRLADAEAAAGSQCNHARGHCEHGDPDACEFLQMACGYDEEDVQSLLSDFEADEVTSFEDLPGEVQGALSRAWTGYKVGVRRLPSLLDDVAEELAFAEEAAAAIAAIEGQLADADHREFEALAAHHERLQGLADQHPRRDHGQPEYETDDDLGEFVDDRDGDQEADDGPTEWEDQGREHRAAQQDGYLRKSTEEKQASDRDGLGRYGMAPSDTQRLSDLEQ